MKTFHSTRSNLEFQATIILEREITRLLKTKSYITIGLVGGSSVSGIFKHLLKKNLPKNKIHFFMIDERRVPLTHKDSNFKLAKDSFLKDLIKKKIIDKEHLHPYYYQRPLEDYELELKTHGGKFDIAILSSGEDAHIAGLFPNLTIKNPSKNFIIFDNSPKLPKKRMSASRKLLEKSQVALLMFFGSSKQQAYKKFKDKKLSTIEVPAKLVNKIKTVYILTDSQ